MIPSEFYRYAMARIKSISDQEERENRRAALICTVVANAAPFRKGKRAKIEDFMPKKKVKKTEKEMYNEIVRLNNLFGGTVQKRGG